MIHELQQEKQQDRVMLIGINTREYDAEFSMLELNELAKTANCQVVSTYIQNRHAPEAATCIGTGKLQEIAQLVKTEKINCLIFDTELSGMQMRNISEIADCKVIDRTMLILDIFASRARTAEGKIQVSLAQYQDRMTRLTGMGKALSRLGGGIGTRGPGETRLETDKRHIRNRIAFLKKALAEIEQHRKFLTKCRQKNDFLTVAIVGYTNAGKSTLFNALTNAGVLEENQLFATLDVTARRLLLPDGRTVILSDTVGFIRRLPHHLVEAFRSTLEETAQADLILHVLDASEPDLQERMNLTGQLLNDLGCAEIPQIHVLNKSDLVENIEKKNHSQTVWISAKRNAGIPELLNAIMQNLPQTAERLTLCIPYQNGGFAERIRQEGKIFTEEYTSEGIIVNALIDQKLLAEARQFIIKLEQENDS